MQTNKKLTNYNQDIQTFFNNIGTEHIPTIANLLKGNEPNKKNVYVFYGSNNGKTAVMNMLRNMMDDGSVINIPGNALSNNIIPFNMLSGVKLLVINDLEVGDWGKVTDYIKIVSSGSKITTRQLFENPKTFKPSCKLIILTNYWMPVFDDALVSRIQFVHFNNIINKDSSLVDRICNQHSYNVHKLLTEWKNENDAEFEMEVDDNSIEFTISI